MARKANSASCMRKELSPVAGPAVFVGADLDGRDDIASEWAARQALKVVLKGAAQMYGGALANAAENLRPLKEAIRSSDVVTLPGCEPSKLMSGATHSCYTRLKRAYRQVRGSRVYIHHADFDLAILRLECEAAGIPSQLHLENITNVICALKLS